MAGGKNLEQATPSPEVQQEQDLTYRDDLVDAIGIIIAPPMHRVDEKGRVIWGQSDGGLTSSPEVIDEFRAEIEKIVADTSNELADPFPLNRTLPSHPYSHPPAAQGIVEFAFMLWEQRDVIIDNLDRLITVGTVVLAISERTKSWFQQKQQSVSEENPPDQPARWITPMGETDPMITWTQAAAAAAVIADAYGRYGVTEGCEVRVYPRANPFTSGPKHPDHQTSYLLRLQDGTRVLIYHLRSNGEVVEHFQLAGDRITPLPIPDLIGHQVSQRVPFSGLAIHTSKRESSGISQRNHSDQ